MADNDSPLPYMSPLPYESPLPYITETRTAGDEVSPPPLPKIRFSGRAESFMDEPVPAHLKETDSPYVRLSKQGGHKDLLKMELPAITEKPKPVPYPRNDWYYHLDNAEADALEKTSTGFQPGDYGFPDDISKEYKKNQMRGSKDLLKMDLPPVVQKPEPVPYPRNEWYYYSDNAKEDALKKSTSYHQVEHNLPRDSVGFSQSSQGVGIPTHGVRKAMPDKPLFNKPKMANRNNCANPRVYGTMAAEEGSAKMEKIMSNSYQQEWQDQSKDHRQRLQASITKSLQPRSEYRRRFGPDMIVWQRAVERHAAVKSRYRLPAKKPGECLEPLPQAKEGRAARGKVQGERFILSRFKKVEPKVDTRRKRIH